MSKQDILKGDVLYWLDPDDGICSGWVTVLDVNTTVLVKGATAEFEVLPEELYSHEV
ncbi:hypothetical protein SEPL_414 [Salmonella phage SE_PL]|nr:hypothetical protein CPT_Munch_004 [Salmonella phage Munch]EHX8550765.1 hypothetical protein [Salmonella enterica]MCP0435960.1 hypothetical protein [Salmonella enterica subsp. enterica serovar Mbandaka]QCW18671.1 hypothetical protein 7t3_0150 [Salmonella phage 7t3]QIG63027.1 hypothetical protein SEPL_414 [Salmonella phage SE_PL]